MNIRPIYKYAAASLLIFGSVVGLTAAIKKRTARLEAEELKRKSAFTAFIAEQKVDRVFKTVGSEWLAQQGRPS